MISDEKAGKKLVNFLKKFRIHPAGNGQLLEFSCRERHNAPKGH